MQDVAVAAGINPNYVWRIEANQMLRPGLELVFKVVAAVRGRGEDIMRLLTAENPTDDMAVSLAKQAQLTPDQIEQAGLYFATDEDTRLFFESMLDVVQSKDLRAKVRSYVSGLRDRDVAPQAEAPHKTSRRRRKQ